MKKNEKNEENCNFQKNEKLQFSEFFSFYYHFLKSFFKSVFIIFASNGAKILQEMENYNFPRVFFHFLIIFLKFFASSGGIDEK